MISNLGGEDQDKVNGRIVGIVCQEAKQTRKRLSWSGWEQILLVVVSTISFLL